MQKEEDLRNRTMDFALRVVRMFSQLPKSTQAQVLGRNGCAAPAGLSKQLLRSGTSIGANYREAFRGRSKAEWNERGERHRRNSRDGSGERVGDERINSLRNAATACVKLKNLRIG